MSNTQVAIKPLPSSLTAAVVERTDETTLLVNLSVAGTARPSARTDIVFVLDASATNRESIESGRMADTVWKVLEYVNQFDDDGIDFFLASTQDAAGDGASKVLSALAAGRSPTDAELARAHGVTAAGQAATREDLQRILDIDGSVMGLAGVLAPALRAAREKRKPTGRLFIEVVTDGRIVDTEAVIREIADMSKECAEGTDKARYRMHILGIGDIDEKLLERLDTGIGDVAPVDIVASDTAESMAEGAQQIFKEMRRSFMSVCPTALLEVQGPGLVGARVMGAPMGADESEKHRFVESVEQLPPELLLELSFSGRPTGASLSLTMVREDGSDDAVNLNIPIP